MKYTIDISDLMTNMHNAKDNNELEDFYQEIRIYISYLDLVDTLKEKLIETAEQIHTFKLNKLNA